MLTHHRHTKTYLDIGCNFDDNTKTPVLKLVLWLMNGAVVGYEEVEPLTPMFVIVLLNIHARVDKLPELSTRLQIMPPCFIHIKLLFLI